MTTLLNASRNSGPWLGLAIVAVPILVLFVLAKIFEGFAGFMLGVSIGVLILSLIGTIFRRKLIIVTPVALILCIVFAHFHDANVTPGVTAARETEKPATAKEGPGNPASQAPAPKFRVFKFKTDVPTSYVVPVKTSDEELKGLLWFFRQNVRAGGFKRIGITQPTAKQWGKFGYNSGMLVVFRGEKCANEYYINDAQIAKGNVGPCGYGEHHDATYQWGIHGDPTKDDGEIRAMNGDLTKVFDYEDNWHPSSEVPQVVDQKVKEGWEAKQEEWEPRQRFAVQMTNQLTKKGIDVHASANVNQPKQLDIQSQLFRNTAFRDTFMNDALPLMRRKFCNSGFLSIRILQESESDVGQSYPLHCH